jgi:hypothetical protein
MTRSIANRPASEAPATTQGVRSRRNALAGAPTVWPQPEQNRALGDSDVPQAGHAAPVRGAPQLEQNFPPPGAPQDGQALGDVLVMVTKLADSGKLIAGQLIHDPGAADSGPEHDQPWVACHHLAHTGGAGAERMSPQVRQGRLDQ